MPNIKKQETISNIVNTLNDKGSVVLIDYTGLSHQQLADVRSKVFEAGGILQVVKNKLFLIALKKAKLPIPEEKLIGPTAVLFTPSEDSSPIKTLHTQAKDLENLKLKWGIWNRELIDSIKIEHLATLPSRNELLSKLVGSMKSPQTRLVISLKSHLQKFVTVLDEIRKQK